MFSIPLVLAKNVEIAKFLALKQKMISYIRKARGLRIQREVLPKVTSPEIN
jgi:hypothetical protein